MMGTHSCGDIWYITVYQEHIHDRIETHPHQKWKRAINARYLRVTSRGCRARGTITYSHTPTVTGKGISAVTDRLTRIRRAVSNSSCPTAFIRRLVPSDKGRRPCRTVPRKIESHRMDLSGSWHSGRSRHEQYRGCSGSSVQDSSRSKQFKLYDTLPHSSGGWYHQTPSSDCMCACSLPRVQRHSDSAKIPT